MKDEKKQSILFAAVKCAEDVGYEKIQRADVAAQAKVATGAVNQYFNTMNQLKRAVVRHAIQHDNHKILFQAIANEHPLVVKLPQDQKLKICSTVINS